MLLTSSSTKLVRTTWQNREVGTRGQQVAGAVQLLEHVAQECVCRQGERVTSSKRWLHTTVAGRQAKGTNILQAPDAFAN
jgi:hypothetical protein